MSKNIDQACIVKQDAQNEFENLDSKIVGRHFDDFNANNTEVKSSNTSHQSLYNSSDNLPRNIVDREDIFEPEIIWG